MSSEGGTIRLETLVELKFLNSSLSELILLWKLDKLFPVEHFEAAASQSTVPSPPSEHLPGVGSLGGIERAARFDEGP